MFYIAQKPDLNICGCKITWMAFMQSAKSVIIKPYQIRLILIVYCITVII